MPDATIRQHLEAIIAKCRWPEVRAEAVAALELLNKRHAYRCGPGCFDCDIRRDPWRKTDKRVAIVDDPEDAPHAD